MSSDRLNANLSLYRRHQVFAGALFWLPTSFLFLIERFGLGRALVVQSAYYFAVVLLEVPSGWLSDKVGRVLTMRAAAIWWVGAHLLFLFGPGTAGVVVAQVLLAAGYAFISGTDVTFHYDTLEALGRVDAFEEREADARRVMLLLSAVSAVVGGALGFVDLRLPFAAALVVAIAQLAIALRLTEPGRETPANITASADTHRSSRRVALGWIASFVVGQVIVVHLVADLTAPYLIEVFDGSLEAPESGVFVMGLVAAGVAFTNAAVVRKVPAVSARIGVAPTLLGAGLVPLVILTLMALTSTAWLVPLLLLRGVQSAAGSVLVPSQVGALVARERRATFLSAASLSGRLGYGLALLVLGGVDASLNVSLVVASAIAAGLWSVTLVGRWVVLDPDDLVHDGTVHPPHRHSHLHVHWGSHDHGHHGEHPAMIGFHRHEHVHRTRSTGGDS